jgi:tetratricopeptide (TPR) repeat protein
VKNFERLHKKINGRAFEACNLIYNKKYNQAHSIYLKLASDIETNNIEIALKNRLITGLLYKNILDDYCLVYTGFGQVSEKLGNLEKAIDCFKKVVNQRFGATHCYERLAIIYDKQGHIEEAINVCKIALGPLRVSNQSTQDAFTSEFSYRLERLEKKLQRKKSERV